MAFSIQGKMSLFYGPNTVYPFCHDTASRAVVCRHMLPTPTNTRLLNLPIERNVFILYALLQKRWVSCQRNQPFKEKFSYNLLWLCVTVRAVLPSKAPFSNNPKLCGTLCCPPNCRWLFTVLPQGNVELHLIGSLKLILMVFGGGRGKFCGNWR